MEGIADDRDEEAKCQGGGTCGDSDHVGLVAGLHLAYAACENRGEDGGDNACEDAEARGRLGDFVVQSVEEDAEPGTECEQADEDRREDAEAVKHGCVDRARRTLHEAKWHGL